MKTKTISILVVVILLFTGINAFATEDTDEGNIIKIAKIEDNISFSQATIESKGEYVTVNVNEANTLLRSTGKPILPVYTKTFKFPKGTKIKNVECTLSDITSEIIDSKIEPSSEPMPRISITNTVNQNEDEEIILEDEDVYSSSEIFPDKWYSYKIGCGLDKDEDVIFLKVNCYPVRYSPAENTLHYMDTFDIHVTYEEAPSPLQPDDEYDLLIITPQRFRLMLFPLYRHKNRMQVSTKIVTTQSIYRDYKNIGRDKPEQIKYFIKDAKENWDIKYLMLVGGLKSHINANDREDINQGSKDWFIPVRYVNPDSYKKGHISDLYYADIYKYNESSGEYEFDDWDSNSNDIFADYGDIIDMEPDVYYGRLACRNLYEVRSVVKKIIRYERTSHKDDTWFKRMIAVGGVTFWYHEGQPDGEWLCNLSIDYMGDLIKEPVRVFASNPDDPGPRPIPKDIIKEFSRGAGFVLFQGHGNSFIWDTKWQGNWTGGLMTFHFPRITNRFKPPIVVVGGCHNGEFNVTFVKTLLDNTTNVDKSNYHAYGTPTSWCFSWKIVAKPRGGAIASTGCTDSGLGWGDPLTLSAMLESNFFYKIGQDNVTTLGEAHSGSIIKYMEDVDLSHSYYTHLYVISEYQLFGDPSLKIGGYE